MINKLLGMPPNASAHGYQIDHMIEFCHWFMLSLFIGWFCFFIYTIWRFRAKNNPKADYHGASGGISNHLEFTVVLIEALLLLGFAYPLWAKRVAEFPDPATAVQIRVYGQQFLWNFHYPGPDGKFGGQSARLVAADNPIGIDLNDPAAKDDIVVKNEFHLPINKPVIIDLHSKDVIHNFALVQMRIAQDAIPGVGIPMHFTPVKKGEFEVICGQLCGAGHYSMRGLLVVDAPEDYEAWLKEKSAS